MKCPFELPVKAEISPVDPDLRYVASVDRSKIGYIFGDCYKDYADYIVHAINSHEKFKAALEKIWHTEVHDDKDCDPYGALGICKNLAEQALKEEAEKEQ